MLDPVFRTTLKNYSTFLLIAASVTVPLHLVYAFVFRDVIATSEFHEAIAALPPEETVKGVGPTDLDVAGIALVATWLAVAALLPPLVRAAARAIESDRAGRVPTALGAWRAVRHRGPRRGRPSAGVVAGALVVTVLVWWPAERIGLLLAEPLGQTLAWLGVGLARGLALALALPWLLVALAEGRPTPAEAGNPRLN
ncbi:MAG: hypothetical protein ACRDKZ_14755 [Actinomycetota bacterium]